MTASTLPAVMKDTILQDAMRRDITTARRIALLEILWEVVANRIRQENPRVSIAEANRMALQRANNQ